MINGGILYKKKERKLVYFGSVDPIYSLVFWWGIEVLVGGVAVDTDKEDGHIRRRNE